MTSSGPLRVLPSSRRIAPSRASRWRAAVLVAVHLLVALHVAHWWLSGETLSPLEPSEAMELSKHGVVNAGLLFFAATILFTGIFGRFFCGWGCHLVALQDLCRWLLARVGIRPRPLRSRLLGWVPAVAFAYMFLWPAAYRLWTGASWPALRMELTTGAFWATFPGWAVALLTFAVCGFVAVYFLGAKGFCTYGCPYGAIFGAADRLAPLRIRVTDACEGCAHCTAVCTSNVRVHEEVREFGMVTSPGCMKCLDCVSVCPKDALYVGAGRPSLLAGRRRGLGKARRDLPWREELWLAASFLLAFFAFRGLYGAFPFLLSLGWAAVLAYASLLTLRLAMAPHVRLRSFALKRSGEIRPAGTLFLALMGLLGALWLHAGAVRLTTARAGILYARATPLLGETAGGSSAERSILLEAIAAADRAERWSLLPDAEMEWRLARLHLGTGDTEAFRRHADAALRLAPGSSRLRTRLGHLHYSRQQLQEAEALYARAVQLDPAEVEAAVNLGWIYYRSGRLDEARQLTAAALESHPEAAPLHYNAALLEVAAGRRHGAVERFGRALALDPDFLEARENLAGLLCSMGRYEEGLVHYRLAVRQSPRDADTRLLMAEAALRLGLSSEAETQIRRVQKLRPDHPSLPRLVRSLASARQSP